jgi:hypothetical protein
VNDATFRRLPLVSLQTRLIKMCATRNQSNLRVLDVSRATLTLSDWVRLATIRELFVRLTPRLTSRPILLAHRRVISVLALSPLTDYAS